ncbi:MAG: Gfo/Idh/MocA family oxidoreductase [Bacteroidetes bacterium]|nr:Gfo/Idh/MocA family oxidoreductase [Bacteroidota bacterium]
MTNTIALLGLGYLGKIHLKLLKENPNWKLAGIYDIDQELTSQLSQQYQVRAFKSLEEAIENAGVLDIVTPANTHFSIAKQGIINGKHLFIEKPCTTSLAEAKQLRLLMNEAGVFVQVGHVERFNPAFIAALPYLRNAAFIEIHRLAQYNPRGTDVSVVLDLMMHDLDLILSVIKANVKRISANGAALVSHTPDIVNARIEFDNGCVANITTNRMALKNTRKFRVFTDKNFVSINLLDKITEVISLKNASANSTNPVLAPLNGLPKKELVFEHPVILPTNAINEELNALYESINSNKPVIVGIDDSIKVMELAFEIESKVNA